MCHLVYNFDYRSLTLYAWPSHAIHLSYTRIMHIRFLQFRSSLLSESLLLSFPLPTKIFQFDRCCLLNSILTLLVSGFSHSDSSGSLRTYRSPKRFAVRRVLLRLLVPRHPLCALWSLTFFIILIRLIFIYFSKISLFEKLLVSQNYIRLDKLYKLFSIF